MRKQQQDSRSWMQTPESCILDLQLEKLTGHLLPRQDGLRTRVARHLGGVRVGLKGGVLGSLSIKQLDTCVLSLPSPAREPEVHPHFVGLVLQLRVSACSPAQFPECQKPGHLPPAVNGGVLLREHNHPRRNDLKIRH